MSIIWPVGLPQDLMEDGLNAPLPDNTVKKSMEVGPPKIRRRDTSAPYPVSGSMFLTYDQYAIFEEFFNTTLASGSLAFEWHHPLNRQTASVTFSKVPSTSATNGMVKLQLDLEMTI